MSLRQIADGLLINLFHELRALVVDRVLRFQEQASQSLNPFVIDFDARSGRLRSCHFHFAFLKALGG